MVLKGQWVALQVNCGISIFRSVGYRLGHGRRRGKRGAQEVHERGTRRALMSTKGDTVFFILTNLGHV